MLKLLMLILLTCIIQESQANIWKFQQSIEKLCSPPSSLHTKKILLILAKAKDEQSLDLIKQLDYLTSQCKNKVSSQEILESYNDFNENENSVLIGE